MKRILIICMLCMVLPFAVFAQNGVSFEIRDGIGDGPLKAKIESETTKLLTMLNTAYSKNKSSLKFENISIDQDTRISLLQIWKHYHIKLFQWDDEEIPYIRESLIKTSKKEYQVRNIRMIFYDVNNKKEDNREICINYDLQGNIVGFYVTLFKHRYTTMKQDAVAVESEMYKTLIKGWMDRLATAYYEKDASFFEAVLSEDALIITGRRIIERVKSDVKAKENSRFEYSIQKKKQFIENLRKVFKKNQYVNVTFKDELIRRSQSDPHIYMVDCTQEFRSSGYDDDGHLFLIWDFTNEDRPIIRVRVWQALDDKKKFTEKDFNF